MSENGIFKVIITPKLMGIFQKIFCIRNFFSEIYECAKFH